MHFVLNHLTNCIKSIVRIKVIYSLNIYSNLTCFISHLNFLYRANYCDKDFIFISQNKYISLLLDCNQTLMGEVGTKYPLRITEPFQRNLPFICKLHLVAGGGTILGETLEITFLSFQIGSLTLDRSGF